MKYIEGLKKLFTPKDIIELYKSPKGKYAVLDFLSNYYQKLKLKEKIDSNELNIIAEFHFYNIEFAKDALLLSDEKAALLINILSMLIAFKDYENVTTKKNEKIIKDKDNENEQVVIRTEEDEYKAAIEQRYDEFKDTILTFSTDDPPTRFRVFTEDEVKKILEYVMETFFQHFRLYSDVLSNKQLSDQKTISVYIDEPLPIPPLVEGLAGNNEREEIESKEFEEYQEEGKVENKEEKDKNVNDVRKEEGKKEDNGKNEGENAGKQPAKVKLDQGDHARLAAKVGAIKSELEAKIVEREKALDKMIEERDKKK